MVQASSDPTSEVPSEYHSETEDATETEEMHSTAGTTAGLMVYTAPLCSLWQEEREERGRPSSLRPASQPLQWTHHHTLEPSGGSSLANTRNTLINSCSLHNTLCNDVYMSVCLHQ